MENVHGYEYSINGHEGLDEFAKGILALANLKSSNQGVVDFKTHAGTQIVTVITTVDNDSYLESHVGEIKSKKEIEIYSVTYDDLSRATQRQVEQLDDGYYDKDEIHHIKLDVMEDW